MELPGSLRAHYKGQNSSDPWVIVRHTIRARTEFYGFFQPVQTPYNRKQPVSESCACTSFRHGLLTIFFPQNARRQSCGARTVSVRVPYGPAGLFGFIFPVRDPSELIQHSMGPVRSPSGLHYYLKDRTIPVRLVAAGLRRVASI